MLLLSEFRDALAVFVASFDVEKGAIQSFSGCVEGFDLLAWLQLQSFDFKVFWQDRDRDVCFAGVGIADDVEGGLSVLDKVSGSAFSYVGLVPFPL